ncbi:MAG: right-handed parallel beta-helix repeat-containing protein, partial [Candidatus Thorarchaeota archaeon]|nr:right-handed parallel beta-helix repeat-containing protein [Candidatus Thorarchaeota archaeon]
VGRSTNCDFDYIEIFGSMYGFKIEDSTYVNISNSYFHTKAFRIMGNRIDYWATHEIYNCSVLSKPILFGKNLKNQNIDGSNYGQVILVNSSDTNVSGGVFDSAHVAISLGFCDNCTIQDLSAYDTSGRTIYIEGSNECGVRNVYIDEVVNDAIHLIHSHNCSVYDSCFERPWEGVNLYNTTDCRVYNNTMIDVYYGVSINSSNRTRTYRNIIYNGHFGVSTGNSHELEIDNNEVYNEDGIGLNLQSTTESNVTGNSIYNCNEYGVVLDPDCHDNMLYNNEIGYDNGVNAVDNGSSNNWDNGSLGNWWSDYGGSGQYDVPGTAGAIDYYPMVLLRIHLPTFERPSEINYEEGTPEIMLSWEVTDYYPGYYTLYLDGTAFSSGPLSAEGATSFLFSVSGHQVGSYEYTLEIS